MLFSAALIGAVLLLFAIATLNARSDRREAAQQRFQDEATVSAALIESLFNSTAPRASQEASTRFGGAVIDQQKLDELRKQNRNTYVLVLDERGKVIARSGSTPDVEAAVAEQPSHVARVIGGAPWALSGVMREDTAEFALGFDTTAGRRVLLQGFPLQLLSGFVAGTLSQLPNADRERAFVLDSKGEVIASAEGNVAPGDQAPPMAGDREQAEQSIANSDWRVSLSQASDDLYRGVGSVAQFMILIALAIAGGVALLLLRRAMHTTQQLEVAYGELARSNADLERANVELQRSNSELEQFASVASHDLQEPLRKVQTFGDQLERRYGEDLNDEAKDYLRRMRNASARMSVLIDDLLRFSRVTTHAKPHIPVDLERVARDVVQDLEARVSETHGRVELGRLPQAQADPTQMRQLLQNLIGNALKFHRPGVPPVVKVSAVDAPRPGTVAFEVADNGIGFEADYQERIFRVFERLHPRDVYAGTGIGLALCRKIAERHGGSITGVGRPGEGATFTVVLPAARPSASGAGAPPAAEPVHV
jgi:signal transduction histidine kinase